MEVNNWLQKGGGRVKSIHAVSEMISSYGYAAGREMIADNGNFVGNIYAYVVIEFD